MTEYLKNPICKFTPLFPINYNNKTNFLSACFFKMVNSGYKDFSKYVDGLINLSNKIDRLGLGYKIRLFIDNSIYTDKSIYGRISKLKNVQPVLYTCANFIVKDDYHIGLFGTLVRFFPFFDFPNNDANIIISSDIDDTNLYIIKDFHIFLKKHNINSNKLCLFKSGPLNRSLKYRFNIMHKDKLNPYIFALSYISGARMDNLVLVNFLNQVKNSTDDFVYSYHYLFDTANKPNEKPPESKYKGHKKFIYGVDEYFLNVTLTDYLVDNKLCWAVKTKWDIFGCLYYGLIESALTSRELTLINLIFKYIYAKLNISFDSKNSPNENFKKLDTIMFSNNYNDKKRAYKINLFLYKLFLYFKTNPNYKFLFPNEYYKLLVDDEKYFGTFNVEFVRVYGCGSSDTDVIFEQNKFIPADIARLKKFYLSHSR